jgi:hypothetical protein
MADAPVVHIGENSPEEVAYKLLREVARAEGMNTVYTTGNNKPTRKWILDTYAECLTAVKDQRVVQKT